MSSYAQSIFIYAVNQPTFQYLSIKQLKCVLYDKTKSLLMNDSKFEIRKIKISKYQFDIISRMFVKLL